MKQPDEDGSAVSITIGKVDSDRRTWMRQISTLAGLAALSGPLAALQGCGGGGGDDAPPGPRPSAGAHGLSFLKIGDNVNPVSVDLAATQASGSTILVCVGRGLGSALPNSQHALPTDNAGNAPYVQQGTAHAYTLWTNAGTALYAFSGATGRPLHRISVPNSPDATDEVTLAVVEVRNGRRIQAKWVERLAPDPLTSDTITTTGPATLVAFWWGDGGVTVHTAVPGNGFTPVDSLLISAQIVQCAVAVRDVATAGTYSVTWTATPVQGAQLWIVAVE